MSPGSGDQSVGERILDLALYGPVGFALSVVEAVPGLVRKGRARLAPQVGMARTVGEFAVHQGYRQFVGFATSRGAFPFAPAAANHTYGPYTARGGRADGVAGRDGSGGHDGDDGHFGPVQADSTGTIDDEADRSHPVALYQPSQPAANEPRADDLAITSYDSLSASQVVQRLAGLSREEVAAVAAYEAATRRRKTVLARAQQLLKTAG
jgi:hypothetical protein